ncbi:BTAD domain-containing putative transcriptional regulator [Streptomyces sp. NPDC101209]|uniref:AfsR/SARP family transcriptional regulator n=1 Tax=Streptomyces sp. NPDC101209 TaxID=3366129 RepID=UPI00381D3E59
MELRILGPVEIYDDRTEAPWMPTGAKQRALLGALTVKAGQVVPADRLVDELWAERPPAGAANALQAHIARLRRQLPPPPVAGAPATARREHAWLATHPLGYVLHAGRTPTDAQRFDHLLTQARTQAAAEPARAQGLLRQALALWRGPALEGCGRGTICSTEAALLEESRLLALEELHDTSLRLGQHRRLTAELRELTAAHPLRERFYELLMTALHRTGRQAEALAVYEQARRRLLHELGIEPGPVLHARLEAILRRRPDPAPHPTAPPPLPPPAADSPMDDHRPHDRSQDRPAPAPHPAPPPTRSRTRREGRGDGPPPAARPGGTGTRAGRPAGPPAPAPHEAHTAPVPGGPQGAGEGEFDLRLLHGEIAQLRHRLETLAREQRDVTDRLGRLERLTARRAPAP